MPNADDFCRVFYLYHIIRRPTYILDFALTLLFNHLILTTYYAASFPTSLFTWSIFILSAVVQIIWAEQLCIKREMRSNLSVGSWGKLDRDDSPSPSVPTHRRATTVSGSIVGGAEEVGMSLLGNSILGNSTNAGPSSGGGGGKNGYAKVSTQES